MKIKKICINKIFGVNELGDIQVTAGIMFAILCMKTLCQVEKPSKVHIY